VVGLEKSSVLRARRVCEGVGSAWSWGGSEIGGAGVGFW